MNPWWLLSLAVLAWWARPIPTRDRRDRPTTDAHPRPYRPGPPPPARPMHRNPFDYAAFDKQFDATWPERRTQVCDLHFVDGTWTTMH